MGADRALFPWQRSESTALLSVNDGVVRLSVYRGLGNELCWLRESPGGASGTTLGSDPEIIPLRYSDAAVGLVPADARGAELSLSDGRTLPVAVSDGVWLALLTPNVLSIRFADDEDRIVKELDLKHRLNRSGESEGRLSDFQGLVYREVVQRNSRQLRVESGPALIVAERDSRDGRVTIVETYPDYSRQTWVLPGRRWGASPEPGAGERTVFGATPEGATLAKGRVQGGKAVPVAVGSVAWLAIVPSNMTTVIEFLDSDGRLVSAEEIPLGRRKREDTT